MAYSKTGDYRGNLFSNVCSKTNCGYTLEPPRQGSSDLYPQYTSVCFEQKYKNNIKNFQLIFFFFTFYISKFLSILHGHVFVKQDKSH